MAVEGTRSTPITYFDGEGRENLVSVVKVVRGRLRKNSTLRGLKLVILTAYGEGPVRAYNMLQEFDPKIIAVTFSLDYTVKHGDQTYKPRIDPKLRKFFDGVGIKVLTGRLPFDQVEGMDGHNRDMQLIRSAMSIFGGGVVLCVQAVLQACDMGELDVGEQVIAISGDWAVLATASTTAAAFTREQGVAINEIFCKPNRLDLCRTPPIKQVETKEPAPPVIEGEVVKKRLEE